MEKEIIEQEIEVEKEQYTIGKFPTGTLEVTRNGTYEVTDYANADVNVTTQMQEKTINVNSNGTQTITPDSGYDGLTQVEINTNVQPTLQSKTISPTTSEIQVTPDSGYDALSGVTINAVTNEIDGNIQASNIKKDVTILGITGTMTPPEPNWSGIGYNETPSFILSDFVKEKEIYDNWNVSTTSMYGYFANYQERANISCLPMIDTHNVTTMRECFSSNCALRAFPSWDTSNVNNMKSMFSMCYGLGYVAPINTSNVTDMYRMFYSCSKLTTVPLFDTGKVTTMEAMFQSCSLLKQVPTFNTENVTNMNDMFYGCARLERFPNLNLAKVTKMERFVSNAFANVEKDVVLNDLLKCLSSVSALSENNRKLSYVGVTSANAQLCTTLENWTLASNAGWITGY